MVVLLVLVTVIACIGVDYVLHGRHETAGAAAPARAASPVPAEAKGGLVVPDGLYYHPGHAWMAVEADGTVRVGMDDFARRLAGPIEEIEPPVVGRTVRQGMPIWTIGRGGKKVAMISPVDGVVDEVNGAVLRAPDAVREDPYGHGWIVRVRVAELGRNARNLLHGPIVRHWMEESLMAIEERFSRGLGVVMADGGTMEDDFSALFPDDEWTAVCRAHFLSDPV